MGSRSRIPFRGIFVNPFSSEYRTDPVEGRHRHRYYDGLRNGAPSRSDGGDCAGDAAHLYRADGNSRHEEV